MAYSVSRRRQQQQQQQQEEPSQQVTVVHTRRSVSRFCKRQGGRFVRIVATGLALPLRPLRRGRYASPSPPPPAVVAVLPTTSSTPAFIRNNRPIPLRESGLGAVATQNLRGGMKDISNAIKYASTILCFYLMVNLAIQHPVPVLMIVMFVYPIILAVLKTPEDSLRIALLETVLNFYIDTWRYYRT